MNKNSTDIDKTIGNKIPAIIPAGSIFTITKGAHSNYEVTGVFRALLDIDTELLSKNWIKMNPDQSEPYKFDEDTFIGRAFREGYFEQLPSFEWHLCDYGSMDEMELTTINEWKEG